MGGDAQRPRPILRILFVEDHVAFARLVAAEFLSGHEITFAPDIDLAMQQLEAHCFDVLLVDYDVGDRKGTELVKHALLRSFPGLIVAVSAHEHGNRLLVDAGAHSVCRKANFPRIEALLLGRGAPRSPSP